MTIQISNNALEYVNEQVALGNFESPEAVVEAALTWMRERNRSAESVRRELQPAIEQLDRGEGVSFEAEAIKRRGRERLAAKKHKNET